MPQLTPRLLTDLPSDLGFQAGFSTISDGNMSYRFGGEAEVYENRRAFFAARNIPGDRLVTFFTHHAEQIDLLEDIEFEQDALRGQPRFDPTDVIVTRTPRTGLFLTFADCVPLAFLDRQQRILCFAHVGWRSMALGLTGKTLAYLRDRCGCQMEDLVVVKGPCIRKESYRFRDPVQARESAWAPFLTLESDGTTAIDLSGFALSEMAAAGLKETQIYAAPEDTAAHPNLFSHYAATVLDRPEKNGRILFYAWMDSPPTN
ncbi:MAG: laccase domain-containing protein [Bacteroidota bacterium]